MRRSLWSLLLLLAVCATLPAQILMPTLPGKSESKRITSPQTFYDDGGASANASRFILSAITFSPKYGEAIEVDFSELDLGDGTLYVYSGREKIKEDYDDEEMETNYSKPTAKPLYTLTSATTLPQLIHATTADGTLTFVYEGKTKPGKGWKAEVRSVAKRTGDQPVPAEPQGTVQMVWGEREVQVGSEPLKFYDDGGEKGNISEGFEGSVTFVPQTAGQVIQITFERLDLFNTFASRNDQLKVFNGRSTSDASTLLKTLLTDPMPLSLLSGESDGTLTVYLKSITGVTKPGFVATVRAISPQGMTFSSATTTAAKPKESPRAGATDVELLSLLVKTDGVTNALRLEGLTFDLAGTTTGALSELSLYAGSTITASKRIGTLQIASSGTTATLTLDADKQQELSYGTNTFTIAGNVGALAKTGDKLAVKLTSVKLSGQDHATSLPATASLAIENTYRSSNGSHTLAVHSPWGFAPTMSFGKYAGGTTNQITTFTPGEAGELVEIQFSAFDVIYSKSSYGAKALFEVYSGKNHTGTPLWKLDDKTAGTIPPLLRSQSEDGALTIVFNPKQTTSTYLGKGWTAEVRSLKPSPMRLVKTEVSQASTATTIIGSSNQEFLAFTLTTAGQLEPKKLEKLQLHLTGGFASFKKVSLYRLTSAKDFASGTLLGEATPTADEVSLSLTTPLDLPEQESYFLLRADLSDAITSGTELDLRLDKLTLSGADEAVTTGDPAGSRRAERIYLLPNNAKETRAITEPLRFYDLGGPNENHPKEYYGTVTFTPRTGEVILLKINNVYFHRNDTLYIYPGTRIVKGKELRRYTGSHNPDISDIVSTSADGALTIHYSGKYATKGWDMEVSSVPVTPLALKSVAVTPVTPMPRLLPGAQTLPLLRLDLTVEGTRGKLELSQLDLAELLPAGGTPWATFSLYDTGDSETFSTAKPFGSTSTTAPTTITGKATYAKSGVYHLFLTADISPEAKVGAESPELSLSPRSLTAGGKEVAITPLASPLKLALTQGIHGTFLVGNSSEANYKTLTEATNDLQAKGVDGPVTLQLLPGRYEENVHIKTIPGLSEKNRLTIEPRDKGSEVTFENKHYKALDYGNDKLGYFTLDAVSYVTLRGLSFVASATKPAPALVQLQHRSQHITIEDCSFKAPKSTSYSTGDLKMLYTFQGKELYPNNDYLTVRNSRFEGGYVGIHAVGVNKVALPGQRGLTIEGCTFKDQGGRAIYATIEELLIKGNTIDCSGDVATGYTGIDATPLGGTVIEQNRIHIGQTNNSGSSLTGISLRESLRDGNVTGTATISNNEIIIRTDADKVAGIGFDIGGSKVAALSILHNSVRIYGASSNTNSAAFAFLPKGGGILSGLTLKNNLFQNEAKGFIFRFTDAAELKRQTIGDNVYSIEGENIARYKKQDLKLVTWRTNASDLSSKVIKTEFATPETSLLPKDFSKLTFARKLSEVPTDLLGTARKANRTAVGAYEERTIALPALREGFPQVVVTDGAIKGLRIKVSEPGKLRYLVKEEGATAPTLDELKAATASPSLAPDVEQTLPVEALEDNTPYLLYYLPEGADGTLGSEVKSAPFETPASALRPADFEAMAVGESSFSAGSWTFSGVEVVNPAKSYSTNSKHALKLASSATIELKNKRQPRAHDGFYLLSQGTLTLSAEVKGSATKTKTLPSTEGQWQYVSLRDLEAFTTLKLSGSGEILLDDFGAEPQKLRLSTPTQETQQGQAVTLTSSVTGGVWPYTYRWTDRLGAEAGLEPTLQVTPQQTTVYTLTVTDSWGESQSQKKVITVRGTAVVASFEDLGLKENSTWHGEAPTDPKEQISQTSFYSGSYTFTNTNWPSAQTWGGFAYSTQTGTSFKDLFPDQFNSAVGSGAKGSKTYAIAYTLGSRTEVGVTHADEAIIPGMYLTNSAWAKDFILKGTSTVSGGRAFKQGDFFTLKITAIPSGKTLEIPLADYRSTDPKEHYLLEDWQWIDLASLGLVKSLRFTLDGSIKNAQGLLIPAYFCIDEFGSEAPAKDASVLALAPKQAQEVDLKKAFADAGLATDLTKEAHFEVLSKSTDAPFTASLSADKLQLQAGEEGEGSLLVMRRQGGKRDYLRLPIAVSKTTPVDEATLQLQIQLYPNPATSEIRMQTDGAVSIYSLTGVCVFETKTYRAGDAINVSSWAPGLYVVRTSQGALRFLKR